jgi:type IV secretory pathway TraG/TraD family ATPase VirD4
MKIPLGHYETGMGLAEFKVNFSRKQFRHALVIGKTGTGKSTILRHIIAHAIAEGLGVFVLDPHGDLIDDAFNYIPAGRLRDVVLLDPENARIPDLGLLDHPDKDRALRAFMTFIEAHAGVGWGPETARILRNIVRAALELFEHPNLLHVYKMLVDDAYAAEMLAKCKHPLTGLFFRQYFVNTTKKDRIKNFSHPLNKIEELMEEGLREFFCQSKSLNFRKLMDEQKIVFCRVPTSYLESRQARVLGSFILMKLKIEASRRKKRKKQVLIIADEYANWTDATDVRSAFAESRKYGTNYIVTTQNLAQLRDEHKRIRNDSIVLGNVSHIFAFRLAADDARQIADEFAQDQEDDKFKQTPNFSYYALSITDGTPVPSNVIALPEYPDIQEDLVPGRKASAWARANTGTPIAAIAAKINKMLQDTSDAHPA